MEEQRQGRQPLSPRQVPGGQGRRVVVVVGVVVVVVVVVVVGSGQAP